MQKLVFRVQQSLLAITGRPAPQQHQLIIRFSVRKRRPVRVIIPQ